MSTQPGSGEQQAENRIGMMIEKVMVGPPHEGEAGQGLMICTNRGDIPAILHAAEETTQSRGLGLRSPGRFRRAGQRTVR